MLCISSTICLVSFPSLLIHNKSRWYSRGWWMSVTPAFVRNMFPLEIWNILQLLVITCKIFKSIWIFIFQTFSIHEKLPSFPDSLSSKALPASSFSPLKFNCLEFDTGRKWKHRLKIVLISSPHSHLRFGTHESTAFNIRWARYDSLSMYMKSICSVASLPISNPNAHAHTQIQQLLKTLWPTLFWLPSHSPHTHVYAAS